MISDPRDPFRKPGKKIWNYEWVFETGFAQYIYIDFEPSTQLYNPPDRYNLTLSMK